MVVCVLLPRFSLTLAAGDRTSLLGEPAALAPEPPGTSQFIGEVSLAAEAFGVRAGMRLGEALARCPRLALFPPDPVGVGEAWERLTQRLEAIGAAVESEHPGLAHFEAWGLRRIHGGTEEEVIAAARRALGVPTRIGAGPTRFCATAAATRARRRRAEIVRGGELAAADYLAPLPATLLRARGRLVELPPALERLGVTTLGEFAALPRAAVADRFGALGLTAHDLACGRDGPLVARLPSEHLEESLTLPESGSGLQLERGLGLLIDRLLARHERRGRTLRAAVLSAVLVEGGTWREHVTFREALADPARMRLALVPRLAGLPAPAEALRLAVERFGPPAIDQCALLDEARPCASGGCAKACARPAPRPAPTPPCASCPSTRARACPSAVPPGSLRVTGPRRLSTPRAATVRAAGADGRPLLVDGREVDAVRESWLIEDRWWTDRPLRRRYWELVTTCGRNVVVFHDLEGGRWFAQR